jgi:hypothetical protein
MAASNVGRPLGNAIAAATDEMGTPDLMYFILAGVFAILLLIVWFVRFPISAPKIEDIIEATQPLKAGKPEPKIN